MEIPDASITGAKVEYTCLIRLPFSRGDFVDPPPVDWDVNKDKALWKIISKAANSKDLDWPSLSTKFQVSLPFLLQQAAWLYERHFAQMRAQMKKLDTNNVPSPAVIQESPGSSSPAIGATSMQRPGSQGSRIPSALSIHAKDALPLGPTLSQGPSTRPLLVSRTPSTRTVTQSRSTIPPSPREGTSRSFRTSSSSQRKTTPINTDDTTTSTPSPPASPTSSTSSSSSPDVSRSLARSQALRRPAGLRTISSGDDRSENSEGESSSGGFLPFAASVAEDPAATLRHPQTQKRVATDRPQASRPQTTTSSTSSASSAAQRAENSKPGATAATKQPAMSGSPANALDPRRRAELAKLSPRVRRDGSDGTPSMGSSFSDLDDASVTQSALEDALLSNIQHGGMGSRMSTFSQLRSKYLPQ